jgi:hypothetical protein
MLCFHQVSRHDVEDAEVRANWHSLNLAPCLEVYSEGNLIGGFTGHVASSAVKVCRTSMTRCSVHELCFEQMCFPAQVDGGHR